MSDLDAGTLLSIRLTLILKWDALSGNTTHKTRVQEREAADVLRCALLLIFLRRHICELRQKYRKRISKIRIARGCDVRRIRGSPATRFSPCFVQPNTGYNRDTLLSFCDSQQDLVSSAVPKPDHGNSWGKFTVGLVVWLPLSLRLSGRKSLWMMKYDFAKYIP